jgi:hypothetical protein
MEKTTSRFEPDYAVSPWATLIECAEDAEERDIPITPEMANALSLMTGVSAEFWTALESEYRKALARLEASGNA